MKKETDPYSLTKRAKFQKYEDLDGPYSNINGHQESVHHQVKYPKYKSDIFNLYRNYGMKNNEENNKNHDDDRLSPRRPRFDEEGAFKPYIPERHETSSTFETINKSKSDDDVYKSLITGFEDKENFGERIMDESPHFEAENNQNSKPFRKVRIVKKIFKMIN